MAQANEPVLSIGMIFKNEIRCLERCMKSLQPLRDAIPCELVMADTGSSDGSREVAEQYADVFFDFPWINDFSAARNAVMDRSSGKWFFSIDCDEWLDEDISGLVKFLTGKDSRSHAVAGLTVRNYTEKEFEMYNDMVGVRLLRMDTGVRFRGSIHESFDFGSKGAKLFRTLTVLHHDGYVADGGPWGAEKQERNMTLLEQQLERTPDDLRTLVECVESARDAGEQERYLRRAVAGVKEKSPRWDSYGPPILRYDVIVAMNRHLTEVNERAELCMELFPQSPYTRIDVSYAMVRVLSEQEKFSELIPWGERYAEGMAEYQKGSKDMSYALLFGTLMMSSPVNEREVYILLSDAYFHEKQFEESRRTLLKIDAGELNEGLLRNYVGILMNLQSHSELEMSGYMTDLWKKITAPGVPEKRAQEYRTAVISAAGHVFKDDWRAKEERSGHRHAYTLFLPLADECETGLAAAVLETLDPLALEEKLLKVKNWDEFPIHALMYALGCGVSFPLPGKPLKLEEMDLLASRMCKAGKSFVPLAIASASHTTSQPQLCWARGLLLAAVSEMSKQLQKVKTARQAAKQIGGEVEEAPDVQTQNMLLLRNFAKVEQQFLSQCYTPGTLSETGIFQLPSMHRFGWYISKAFPALNSGDPAGYTRHLREGLSSCEEMKPVVEFLMEHTPELQTPPPSQELKELADKVREMLAAFSPVDPAVAAIRQSPVYQKVAHLIEGLEVPVTGGLAQ